MKILNLSLDGKIFDNSSKLGRRMAEYGEVVEKYTVLALGNNNQELILSPRVKAYAISGLNKVFKLLNFYSQAKEILEREKYNVITVQDQYYLALIGLRLAKKFKAGLEIQVHGFEKFYGLRRLIAKYVLSRTAAVRCVSQRLKKQLVSEFAIKEDKITVVPIYSELRITSLCQGSGGQANYELRIKENKNKFVFLTVGRLVPVKNIGMQIEAMKEVVKKYPAAELWIIGDGTERKNYELRITNYELEKNIKLFGWKNNLAEYYSTADAFILTSDAEGWGLAVIEAASFGLPIIMTDVGLAGEVIIDNESGLVIPVRDRARLVEAMVKIIKEEKMRKKLGERARLAVQKLPTKAETLALYKKSWERAIVNL